MAAVSYKSKIIGLAGSDVQDRKQSALNGGLFDAVARVVGDGSQYALRQAVKGPVDHVARRAGWLIKEALHDKF
jgi:hypothetical protein